MAERFIGKSVMEIDGKEYEITIYSGDDQEAVDRAFRRRISTIMDRYWAEQEAAAGQV